MTVSANLSVVRLESGHLRLWRAGADDAVTMDATQLWPDNTVFAVPADAVRVVKKNLASDEAKHLRKSLPFLMEEEVIDDIDDLHFAYHLHENGGLEVAIVARQTIDAWHALLPAEWDGAWVPECLLLPVQSDEMCLVVEGETVLARWSVGQEGAGQIDAVPVNPPKTGVTEGTRLPRALLAALIETMNPIPNAIIMYGHDQAADKAWVPEALHDRVQWRHGGFGQALLLVDGRQSPLNLRQGDYAPRLPFARWWSLWRTVAVVAGVALLLQLGNDMVNYQRLSNENIALRAAIQERYRQANPQGAVVDVEKQLDRQLAEYNPAAAGVAFTPLLASISQALAGEGATSVSTLNFDASNGDVRLDLLADSYTSIESLRQRLTSAGLTATLETSSSRNDRVRARLRIGGGRR